MFRHKIIELLFFSNFNIINSAKKSTVMPIHDEDLCTNLHSGPVELAFIREIGGFFLIDQ